MRNFILFLSLLSFVSNPASSASFGSSKVSRPSSSSTSRPSTPPPRPASAPPSKPSSFGSSKASAPKAVTPPPATPIPSAVAPATPKKTFGASAVVGGAAVGVAAGTAVHAATTPEPTPVQAPTPAPASPDAKAAAAQKSAESKVSFDAYKRRKAEENAPAAAAPAAPRPTWTKTYQVDSKTYWQERDNRERVVYRDYYSQPRPVQTVSYHDSFNPLLFYWLGRQSVDVQAATLYNRRDEMDRARYEAELAKNADLRVKVAELEAKGKPDPNFVPQGMEPDLMYSKEKVNELAAVKPAEVKKEEPSSPITTGIVTFVVVSSLLGAVWFIYKKVKA